MTIIETLESAGHSALTAVQHAAAWLVGTVATASTSLHELEASNPLVAEAIAAGEAAAAAHGIPIAAIETTGEDVLAAAKELSAGLAQTAPQTVVTAAASSATA